jgi:hypothetical protein
MPGGPCIIGPSGYSVGKLRAWGIERDSPRSIAVAGVRDDRRPNHCARVRRQDVGGVLSVPRRLGLRPEKQPSGACLTMAAPARVIRRPVGDRLDHEVVRPMGTKRGLRRWGRLQVVFQSSRRGLAASRRATDRPPPQRAGRSRRRPGAQRVAAPKARRPCGAMRPARTVRSKNAPQAVPSAFAGIRHRRSGQPGGRP